MRKCTVDIALLHEKITVDAWQPGVPGLVVNVARLVDGRTYGPPEFVVTHVASGFSVDAGKFIFSTKAAARTFARSLSDFDWTRSQAEIVADKEGLIRIGILPAPTGPVHPEVCHADHSLLDILAEEWGFEDSHELVEEYALCSVQPGICRQCQNTTSSCEPDARDNWCYACEENAVVSVGVLAGLV